MKILIVGREGQLAWELRRSLAYFGEVIAIDRRSKPLSIDLSVSDSIRTAVREIHPDLIFNAAAYTAVDKAEQEPQLAYQVNGNALGILAEAAKEIGAGIIHYSTDYVFSGTDKHRYKEDDDTAPQSIYGKSKRKGEIAITQTGVPHFILRTSWIYGVRGNNFLRTVLRLLNGQQDPLRIVADQLGAPTWSRQVAECTALLLQQNIAERHFQPDREKCGIYHMTCGGDTSWHGFANQIRVLALESKMITDNAPTIQGISSGEYPTSARRPAFSALSNEKLARHFGLRLPCWETALRLCMADYANCNRR